MIYILYYKYYYELFLSFLKRLTDQKVIEI